MNEQQNQIIDGLGVAFQRLAREALRQNPIKVQQAPGGGYEVVLRLDGTYTYREDADDVAAALADALIVNSVPEALVSFQHAQMAGPGAGLFDLFVAIGSREDADDVAAALADALIVNSVPEALVSFQHAQMAGPGAGLFDLFVAIGSREDEAVEQ